MKKYKYTKYNTMDSLLSSQAFCLLIVAMVAFLLAATFFIVDARLASHYHVYSWHGDILIWVGVAMVAFMGIALADLAVISIAKVIIYSASSARNLFGHIVFWSWVPYNALRNIIQASNKTRRHA